MLVFKCAGVSFQVSKNVNNFQYETNNIVNFLYIVPTSHSE